MGRRAHRRNARHEDVPVLPPALAIITQFYPPDFAATGQFVSELAAALAATTVKVRVFTGQPAYAYTQAQAPREEVRAGVLIQRTASARFVPQRIRGKLLNGLIYSLRCAIKLRRPPVRGSHTLYTSAPPFLPVVGWFYHKFFGQAYSCLVYDLYPDVAVRLGVVGPRHSLVKLWDFFNARVWRRAQSIIVLSEPMRRLVCQKHPDLAEKVFVVPSWANPDLIQPLPKADNWFAREHGLDRRFTVLYSGNLGRCHDAETLAAAIPALVGTGIQFVFVGSGAGYQALKKELAPCDNVLFLPYQLPEVLPYSLTACDVSVVSLRPNVGDVVAPSKFYGMLAAGRPVLAICRNDCYLKPLLEENRCGRAIANGDVAGLVDFLRSLQADPAAAAAMGQRARQLLEDRFTLQHAAQGYRQALGLTPEEPPP
ncbi:MAG: glycosyltransferase family 4 protein [Oscillatoriales cyanobacterium SM2_1_8]|nr:glycosyltransferase family 4 protein [Oscillatoriales cyanobacterium SM2_1_8]